MALVVGGLCGLAAVLAIKIYQGHSLSKQPDSASTQTHVQERIYPRELTPAEQEVLKTPQRNATEAERKAHFEKVIPLAKEAEFLDISTCLGDPVVMRIKQGGKFTVRNNDTREHIIQMNEKLQFAVPAEGSKEITADFGFGPGTYGYGCDNSAGAAGIFFVN